MYLTSITNLKLNKTQFEIIDEMSYRAKSLYNYALYKINKHFEETNEYLSFSKIDKLLKSEDDGIYRSLPAQISQQLLKKLDKNYKSFFTLLKKKQTNDYDKKIKPPKYLPKDGRKELIFQKQSFKIENDKLYLTIPQDLKQKYDIKFLELPLPPYIKNKTIKYIEIIPKNSYYQLSIIYEVNELEPKTEFKNWLSIDIGLNNLLTCTSNVCNAFIINGKPLKSINQKFNKKISKLKSVAEKQNGKRTTKKIQQLFSKRANKLNNEIHKITDFIVKIIKEYNIDKVFIGYNKEWKQNINIGKRNNQNFVQIPYQKIVQQLQYKLLLLGIELILIEEAYTSKTSALDLEPIKKQQTYKGRRVKRGLFQTAKGVLINADVNGSLNIFRKAISKLKKVVQDELFKLHWIVGLVMNPVKITLNTTMNLNKINSLVLSLQSETVKKN